MQALCYPEWHGSGTHVRSIKTDGASATWPAAPEIGDLRHAEAPRGLGLHHEQVAVLARREPERLRVRPPQQCLAQREGAACDRYALRAATV
jgi:hypothetical protein